MVNGRTSPHADQYSLAVTYCKLRGGRLPFEGPVAAVLAGHLHGEPKLSMIPVGERTVVAKALSKDADHRFRDCKAFVAALRSVTRDRRDADSR
jgi:hypothetical protein